jgi:hypothetical protein
MATTQMHMRTFFAATVAALLPSSILAEAPAHNTLQLAQYVTTMPQGQGSNPNNQSITSGCNPQTGAGCGSGSGTKSNTTSTGTKTTTGKQQQGRRSQRSPEQLLYDAYKNKKP